MKVKIKNKELGKIIISVKDEEIILVTKLIEDFMELLKSCDEEELDKITEMVEEIRDESINETLD